MTRVLPTVLLLVLVLLAASLPPAAHAARSRSVCAKSATLRDSPRGFVIARLVRGQRVVVVRRSAARGWTTVRTSSTGLPGWILTRSLCRG